MQHEELDKPFPLFTIGIASYNYAEYITKALDSIKKQEFKNYEVLISDDCSSDNSIDVIKSYMNNNPDMCIRLLESPVNEGIIANKNKIINSSLGEYIMLCDSDDWMADHCLQKMAEVIEKEHPDRIISEVANIKPNGEVIQIQHLLPMQSKWCWTIYHGGVYRRDVVVKHNIRMIDDMDDDLYFITEFNKYCNKVSLIPEVLYYWNVHIDSAGRQSLEAGYLVSHFEKELKYIYDTIQYIKDRADDNCEGDIEELRFLGLKLYYLYILFPLQQESLKEKLRFYRLLHSTMKKMDDKYLNNVLLHGKEPPVRKSTFMIMKLCVILERINLLGMSLIPFHLLTRFKYIDQ